MNKDGAIEIVFIILSEAYSKSNPPLNFRVAMEHGECTIPGWYNRYFITEELMEKIITKHTRKLNKFWTNQIRTEVMNYGPRYSK